MSDSSNWNRAWRKVYPARTQVFHSVVLGKKVREVVHLPALVLTARVHTMPTAGAALLNEKLYVTPAGVAKRAKGVALGFVKGEKDVTAPLTAVAKVMKIMTGKGQVKKGKK